MRYRYSLVLIALASFATLLFITQDHSSPPTREFQQWKALHSIKYGSSLEESYRKRIFMSNYEKIKSHNSDEKNSYQMGLNQFSDLTDEQFSHLFLQKGYKIDELKQADADVAVKLGEDIDWVAKGAVTAVKNQGPMGQSTIFSTSGAIEGLNKLTSGTLVGFSDQQLLDCAQCEMIKSCFNYVRDKGLSTAAEYPSKGSKQACQKDGGKFKIKSVQTLNTCAKLAGGLMERPISVIVDASNWATYRSGILSNCGTTLNHAVLLVGMTDQFWLLKNSWGASWGQSGYIRIARGNTCGVCNLGTTPFN